MKYVNTMLARSLTLLLLVCIFAALPAWSATDILTVTIQPNSINPPPPPPAGGGGGGGAYTPPVATGVIFRGIAYPGSIVTLTRDGVSIAEVPASPDANFEIQISQSNGGTYTYGVSSVDKNGIRSLIRSFTVMITPGVTTVISGIFLSPTISIDKSQVARGDVLTILGQTAPDAKVNIMLHSGTQLNKTATSSKDGTWSYKLDTLELDFGDHTTQARTTKNQDISALSEVLGFKVGTSNVAVVPMKCGSGDFNCDKHVNLIDFSILAYWFGRTNPPKNIDLKADGLVNIVDFSILAYYWTG